MLKESRPYGYRWQHIIAVFGVIAAIFGASALWFGHFKDRDPGITHIQSSQGNRSPNVVTKEGDVSINY